MQEPTLQEAVPPATKTAPKVPQSAFGPLGALALWIARQMQYKPSKKAQRRLRRGEAGAHAQANADANDRAHKEKVKLKARARRKATKRMKARVRNRAA